MTAYVMPGDREKCFDAGMDDYLAKPVSIEELSQVLGKWSGAVKEVSPSRMPELNLQQPEGHEQRMLDRSIVVELREVMEDGFGELVETYLNSSPELMDALQKAVDTEDVEAMAAPAHSLKSSSANMGATKLSSLARAVESAARERDMKKALAAYRKMPTVYLATCAALRFELGRE
jgi:HPt (histidine-containing phosphotransfer) domain-containing protein